MLLSGPGGVSCVRYPEYGCHRSYGHLFFPAFQNLVCILEAGLTCLKDSTVAGFLDDLHGKAIGSKPGVHQCDLCLYGIAVGDSESLENRKIVFIISGARLLGFFHRGNPLLSPGKSHLLDIADALVIVAHAIFNQIFDQSADMPRPS